MKIVKNLKWLVIFFVIAFIIFGLWLCKELFINSDGPMYGNRINTIKDIDFSKQAQTEVYEFIKSQSGVVNTKVIEHGPIINVIIYVEADTTAMEAKNIAEKSLEKFPENILKNYDLGFLINIESEQKIEGYPINGSKSKNSLKIVW